MAKGDSRLFDLLLQSSTVKNSNKLWMYRNSPNFSELLRSSHKFVFSDEAAVSIAQAIKSYPEMLVDNGPFAIPPFERTWIEFPSRNFNYQFIQDGLEYPTTDSIVGFLIDGNRVYVASTREGEDTPMFLPFHYELHRPMSFEEEKRATDFFSTSRAQLDGFFWGHTFYRESGLTQTYKRSLRLMHSFVLDFESARLDDSLPGRQLFVGAAGELRNILGMLLAINQPSRYRYLRNVGHKRRLTSKGTRVFMAHSIVEFNIKRTGFKRLLSKNKDIVSQRSMRWHEVKGHFCHDRAGRQETGCNHDGGQLWEKVGHRKWVCSKCGGRRWWREYPNGHGSAKVGFVSSRHFIES